MGRGADEVRTPGLLSGEAHDARLDRCPTDGGGRCKRKGLKREKTRPKKRSMLVRWPSSSAVQLGGRHVRFFWRFAFQILVANCKTEHDS